MEDLWLDLDDAGDEFKVYGFFHDWSDKSMTGNSRVGFTTDETKSVAMVYPAFSSSVKDR